MQPRRVSIFGSTGSIGVQTLEVIEASKSAFQAEVLTAQNNHTLLIEQARKFKPKWVVIGDEFKYGVVKSGLQDLSIQVLAGEKGLLEAAALDETDLVLTALVGFAGLRPTIAAIEAGKNIALANKETLVVAGEIVTKKAKQKNVQIIPVDSEHSAIFQCLVGENPTSIDKIYLTASGGPFRGFSSEQIAEVSLAQALKHPNWSMGNKITIDSATMMNKGLEVIEARWLFGVPSKKIEVIVHPQSIIHSMVEFRDGSIKAQMGKPDMRLPILYAMGYPERLEGKFSRFNFKEHPSLTFEMPDRKVFRSLDYAYFALEKGGNLPCVLNAANEAAVAAFLAEKIPFYQIFDFIKTAMANVAFDKNPSIEDLIQSDSDTRKMVESFF